jgi:hypothetical protein
MNGQRGKMTFMSLIAALILLIGGFMAFKYIGNGLEKKQIKKEVFDTLGTFRGSQMDSDKAMESIEEVLQKKQVEIIEVWAEVDKENVIHYSFKYKIDTNYLFFKGSETIEVVDEIANYS